MKVVWSHMFFLMFPNRILASPRFATVRCNMTSQLSSCFLKFPNESCSNQFAPNRPHSFRKVSLQFGVKIAVCKLPVVVLMIGEGGLAIAPGRRLEDDGKRSSDAGRCITAR